MPNSAVRSRCAQRGGENFGLRRESDRTGTVRTVTLGVVDGERVAGRPRPQRQESVVTEGGERCAMARRWQLPARRRPRPPRSRPEMHSPALEVRRHHAAETSPQNHRHDVDRGHANRHAATCSRLVRSAAAVLNPYAQIFILRRSATPL